MWAVAAASFAACTGTGTPSATTTSPAPTGSATASATAVPSPTGSATSTGGVATSTTSKPGVPNADELARHLITPADLGADWSLWEGFSSWPGGAPGVIPADQRALVPDLPMCPSAGEAAVALAEGVQWQAFTQLHRVTQDPFANMVVVQEFLLADEPATTAMTFTTLRDGLAKCLTANLPAGDWEIGLREELAVPAVGDDRYAERRSSVDSGGARRDTRWVLVRDGEVLTVIQLDDVLIKPEAQPVVTAAVADDVISKAAGKLE